MTCHWERRTSTMSRFYILLVLLFSRTHCEHDQVPNLETITVEDYVYVLDHSNYDSFVAQHTMALVEFYAPWCGHCKSLAPEFSKAAKILQDDENRVVLAKVDATKFSELAQQHGVTGFPTLFVYRNGVKTEYDGPRTSQGIVDYMRQVADPNYQPPEEAVISLTQSNFDETVERESLILVEFYAPWCGHCKRLKPEYERAARRLQNIENPIKLTKIDATEEKDLASRFSVSGYPTLFIFRAGKQYPYKGPRDENGIVEYMKQMQLPSSKLVLSREHLKKQIREDIPTIVGFFKSESGPEFELFQEVAYNQFDEPNHFVHVTDQKLIEQIKQKPNTLSLFIPLWFRSKYEPNQHLLNLDENLTVEKVIYFIGNHSCPLVGYRNSKSYSIYANKYPLVVVYYDVDFSFDHRKQTQMIRAQVLEAAAQFKNEDLTFAIANEAENLHELKELKLDDSGEDVNVGYFESPKKRYAMEPTDEFNSEVLIEFVLAVRTGKITPVTRSGFAPEQNPVYNLWTVVGDTFDQLVSNSKHDILLEFYAPWCGHCKALEPIYQQLAKSLESRSDQIRVMKLDATSNDYPDWFEVSGFPTLYYIPAKDGKPIQYQGERTLEALLKFVENHLDRRKDEL